MNLDDSLQRLFHRNLHIIKLDLEPMRALLERLGNPHHSFVAVHVAGTNGKGSVCAMLDSILREQGYRTGLYTSPHLIKFNERIKIGGENISDESLEQLIKEIEELSVILPEMGLRDVTFFEFTTALAFLHFQRSAVEIAVVETGMGGRLDATNLLVPAVSVITSIGVEHQQYLGDTIEKIAGEKAGIIKPGRPVILGDIDDVACGVIKKKAGDVSAPLRISSETVNVAIKNMSLGGQTLKASSASTDYGTIHTKMNGMHQAENAAISIAVAECLDQEVGISISPESIRDGLAQARWPARCEVVSEEPPIVIDGGHNPDAAKALSSWIKKVADGKPLGMIVGFLADKQPDAFMNEFSGLAKKIWMVPLQSERGMPLKELQTRLAFIKHTIACDHLSDAMTQAVEWSKQESGIILATGSLYLAGEILANQKR